MGLDRSLAFSWESHCRTRPAQEPHETGHGIGNSGTAGGSATVYNLLW